MEKKRIIALGIATLSFVTAAAVTSTVAWYTGSSYLTISDINVKVKNPELSISLTGESNSFVSELTSEELMQVKKFKAVSSMFSDEWLDNKEEKPTFRSSFHIGEQYVFNHSNYIKEATEGYFSQTFFVKSTIDAYFTVDSKLTSFLPDYEANNDLLNDEEFMHKMHVAFPSLNDDELKVRVEENLNNVVKSLRLSILVLDDDNTDAYDDYAYYIIDPYKDKDTYLGGILDTVGTGYYDTYHQKEILYGEVSSTNPSKSVEESIIYKEPLDNEISVRKEDCTCFYAGNAAGDQKIDFDQSEIDIKKENSISFEEMEEKVLIPVSPSKPTRLVLSFYQEGWDLENTDFIRYSHFLVNVLFKIAPVMPRF